jgi:hypothetical protein
VPAHRWKFGGRLEAHNHGPGSGVFEMENLLTSDSQQRLEENAAYGYLPLTDTAVSDVAVRASRNAVYCLTGALHLVADHTAASCHTRASTFVNTTTTAQMPRNYPFELDRIRIALSAKPISHYQLSS